MADTFFYTQQSIDFVWNSKIPAFEVYGVTEDIIIICLMGMTNFCPGWHQAICFCFCPFLMDYRQNSVVLLHYSVSYHHGILEIIFHASMSNCILSLLLYNFHHELEFINLNSIKWLKAIPFPVLHSNDRSTKLSFWWILNTSIVWRISKW